MSTVTTSFNQTFTHHTATVRDDMRLHYVSGGQGEPVVLLHGCPETWYSWRRVMPALAEQYTVIAPDLGGLGDSSKLKGPYTKRDAAEDIYKLVRQLGFERIYLVGTDWGCAVAYAYAANHSENVRQLALMECPLPGLGAEEFMDTSKPGAIWHFAFHMVPDLPEAIIAGKERTYLTWFYKTLSYNPAAITEEDIDEYVRCYSAPGALRSWSEYYRSFFQDAQDNRESAKTKLKMPVLTVGGDQSLGDHLEKMSPAFAEKIHSVKLENCGHWLAEERPEELIQHLLTFLGEKE